MAQRRNARQHENKNCTLTLYIGFNDAVLVYLIIHKLSKNNEIACSVISGATFHCFSKHVCTLNLQKLSAPFFSKSLNVFSCAT